jgi:hypothetical protein
MTGMERNSDIVQLAAYAPLMVHAEDHRCPTNLIVFDNHRLVFPVSAHLQETLLTSGPFGSSMSAADRPKRWGVSRQAKGREIDPTRVEFLCSLLDRRAIKGTWGNLGKQKGRDIIFKMDCV